MPRVCPRSVPEIPTRFRLPAAFTNLLDRLGGEGADAGVRSRFARGGDDAHPPASAENAPAYYALRFREIADAVESGLDDERLVRAVERGASRDRFLLAATEAAWEGRGGAGTRTSSCPAADKFLKLSAQIVAWYDGWLSEGVAAVGAEAARGTEATEGAEGAEASGDGSTGDGSTADAAAPRPPRSWGARRRATTISSPRARTSTCSSAEW